MLEYSRCVAFMCVFVQGDRLAVTCHTARHQSILHTYDVASSRVLLIEAQGPGWDPSTVRGKAWSAEGKWLTVVKFGSEPADTKITSWILDGHTGETLSHVVLPMSSQSVSLHSWYCNMSCTLFATSESAGRGLCPSEGYEVWVAVDRGGASQR